MNGKRRNLGIAIVAVAVVATIIITVSLTGSRSTESLIKDLSSTSARRLTSAAYTLRERGAECVPELVQAYKNSADVEDRRIIARVIINMPAWKHRDAIVAALIEFLAEEKDPRLKQEIVTALRLSSGRGYLEEDPLGEDAEAWRKWWQDNQANKGLTTELGGTKK